MVFADLFISHQLCLKRFNNLYYMKTTSAYRSVHSLLEFNKPNLVCFLLLLLAFIGNTTQASAQGYIQSLKVMKAITGDEYVNVQKTVNGKTYVGGTTTSKDLPVTNGSKFSGTDAGFLAVFNAAGDVTFATYMGGSGEVDDIVPVNGKIYVCYKLSSTGFPVTDGSTLKGITDYGLIIFDESTGAVLYGSYIGGNDYENPTGNGALFVDNNFIYITGSTTSTDFFTTDGTNNISTAAAFVRKYTLGGTLVYSTLLTSTDVDNAEAKGSVLYNGVIYLTAQITGYNYPTTDGSGATLGMDDGNKVVVTALNPNGTIQFSKFITGGDNFIPLHILADANGVFVTGSANTARMPTTIGGPYLGTGSFPYYYDYFAVKLNFDGSTAYARYLASDGYESSLETVVENGELYLLGVTEGANYPVVNGMTHFGSTDMVLTKLNSTGAIAYSTYYGGPQDDGNYPLLSVLNGEAYVMSFVNILTGGGIKTTDGSINGTCVLAKFTTTGTLCMASQFKGAIYLTSINGEASDLSISGNTVTWGGAIFQNTDGGVTSAPYASFKDAAVIKFTFCPTPPVVASDPITPATQNVCINGLVQQLVGNDIVLSGSALPLQYDAFGVVTQQNAIRFNYQWQSATSAGGPWTDIPGEIQKNYSPPATTTSMYFRRITKQSDCCGAGIISTSAIASVLVTANTAPVVEAGGGVASILQTCPSSAITIGGAPSASAGLAPYTYAWTNGATAVANPSISPATSSVYTLTVTDANGCKQADQVIVNAFTANAGVDKSVCNAATPVVIGTAQPAGATGLAYSWVRISGTGTLSSTTEPQPTVTGVTSTSVYRVTLTVTKSGGGTCSTTDDVTINTSAVPTANFAGPDNVLCLGGDVVIGTPAQAGFTYSWSPGNYLGTSGSLANFNPGNVSMPIPNVITYTLTAANTASGCVFTDDVSIAVIEADAGIDGCGPRYIGKPDRTPNLNETYSWSIVAGPGTGTFLGATDQPQIPVGGSVGGDVTYQLTTTYTLNGVTGTCTDQVVVPPCLSPVCAIDVVAETGCASYDLNGGNVAFKAVPPGDSNLYSYDWSPKAGLSSYNTQTVLLTDNVARMYTVTIKSLIDPAYTCTASKQANSALNALPVFNAPNTVTACSNAAVLIGDPGSNPGYSYLWNGTGLNSTGISRPTATTPKTEEYIVKVTDIVTGCFISDSVLVIRNVADAGPDQNVCGSGIVTLGTFAEANCTYSWSPAGADWRNSTNQFSAQPDVFVATTTIFTLTKTNTISGCVSVDAVTVTASPVIAPFTLSPLTYCPSAVALRPGYSNGTAGGINEVPNAAGYTYRWDPAGLLVSATLRNPTLKIPMPNIPTTLTVVVTNSAGCSQTATQTITPSVSSVDAGPDKNICLGTSTSIGSASNPVGGGITYSWSPATGLSSSTSPNPTFTPTVKAKTIFTLTKTSAGCSTKDQVVIDVLSVTFPAIPPVTACNGSSVIVGPSPADASLTYKWTPSTGLSSTTIANPTATVTSTQIYTFTATNALGCVGSGTVGVAINAAASPTVTVPNIAACWGDLTPQFNATVSPVGAYTYQWTPATTLSSSTVANPLVSTGSTGIFKYKLLVTNTATGCTGTAFNATATITPCSAFPVTISGHVFLDVDTLADGTVDGTGIGLPGGQQVYVSLIAPNGKAIASVPVEPNGTYSFFGVAGNTTYTVVLSTTFGLVSNNTPVISLPPTWRNTGENLGAGIGNDGLIDGVLGSITAGVTDISEANFGLFFSGLLSNNGIKIQALLNSNTASVYWTAANGMNATHFFVERSTNNKDFFTVGGMPATVNNTGTYHLDDNVTTLTGFIYYRIKAVNTNGKIIYSAIVAVNKNGINNKAISVYPNPFINDFALSMYSDKTTILHIRLVDGIGKTIFRQQYPVSKGNNRVNVAGLNKMASGVYTLVATDEAGNIYGIKKVLKKY
jgi:hypothetical protein